MPLSCFAGLLLSASAIAIVTGIWNDDRGSGLWVGVVQGFEVAQVSEAASQPRRRQMILARGQRRSK